MDFSAISPNAVAVAVLVSNDYQPLGEDYELYGTHKDADNLESLFKGFGYVVYKWRNVSYGDFISRCESLARYPYPQTCTKVIIFFAGHGSDGVLMMQDEEYVNIDGIMELFKPDIANNAILATIAKIFLIDACRGREKDHGYVSQGRARGDTSQSPYKVRVPIEGNFLVAYGSTRFYNVTETPAGGRWTNCLVKALQESKETDKAEDVLKNANKMMHKEDAYCFQTAEYTSNLRIEVFFKDMHTAHPFNCLEEAKKLKEKSPQLILLPYDNIKESLGDKGVITRREKQELARMHMINDDQMSKVLDIVTTSLKLKLPTKYKGFLEAMEGSGDQAFEKIAEELGGSKRVPSK